MTINELLQTTIDKNASDLHIVPEHFSSVRINNELLLLRAAGRLTGKETQELLIPILSESQKVFFNENKELDFGYDFGEHRFRVNIYTNKKNIAAAFRLIPTKIKSIDELGLPSIFHTFTTMRQGLVLFTGPAGEGKSTSMAAIINEINDKYSKHIITIEDPIEFTYPQSKSIISQRELHQDTLSWSVALKSALREDPDIVLVGEIRDHETIQLVLTLAETGHLVFSTLHTGSAREAIDRIVDVFPSNQQNQVRNSLSGTLVSVIAQRLIPDSSGLSRIPAFEILTNNASVSSIIRDGKNFMLDNVLETNEDAGMILFEKYLAKLYRSGQITKEEAVDHAIRKNLISKFIT
ncbi:type IV pili twitching motility protein PilT [Candidatus Roizmanbacteria bacterium CG_4_10_14_0_8_um_filter_39_9]|uniref:Type IV pili twitching motility protein PilT n=1 Tax=Candidatus Roizmanbacteria bacterium CG_4_10_14_0_8_um_filter_39_9 TaxID=1974829 RepID=A0A2M7QBL6_9BACT|nr:MAG: type IV pili twitching motility protein PilT [Candidatus Roizmanbacteria bacterium CG_4_10_14_0_8_um_filter_39_9]